MDAPIRDPVQEPTAQECAVAGRVSVGHLREAELLDRLREICELLLWHPRQVPLRPFAREKVLHVQLDISRDQLDHQLLQLLRVVVHDEPRCRLPLPVRLVLTYELLGIFFFRPTKSVFFLPRKRNR